MESNHKEDSINSSEEVDQPEQENNDGGAGRSYECVFCKRGFTTAQALGGHMNIHRKNRAKNRPTSIKLKGHEENYTSPLFYQSISSYPPLHSAAQESLMNYRTYFPASTSNTTTLFENHCSNFHDCGPQRLPFGEDCSMSLSLRFGSAYAQDMENKVRGGSAEDELNLELQLGHNP
ncbi:unnamed protein product [Ilex paraguariensis]|uniref:C2H2-type domain-containing protein n=1 Tax=Ilex paraguariensis TaxID=185542 RepID=A0ABC8S072_9AQUA